ncbi:MAG: hypothetical protein AAF845_20480 [Bacteroidota bacterium]
MRALLLAALVAALPAAAQNAGPGFAVVPAPGAYAEGGLGLGWSSSSGLLVGGSVGLGYQLPNGFDVAVRTNGVRYGDERGVLAVQPEVGYTRGLDAQTVLSVRLGARGTMASNPVYEDPDLGVRSVAGIGHVAVARRLDLGPNLYLVPTVGAYGGVGDATNTGLAPNDGGLASYDGTFAEAGALAGLQLGFRALGTQFRVGPIVNVPVLRSGASAHGASGLGLRPIYPSARINF